MLPRKVHSWFKTTVETHRLRKHWTKKREKTNILSSELLRSNTLILVSLIKQPFHFNTLTTTWVQCACTKLTQPLEEEAGTPGPNRSHLSSSTPSARPDDLPQAFADSSHVLLGVTVLHSRSLWLARAARTPLKEKQVCGQPVSG